jgi:phage FluMu protein Com
MQYFYLQMWHWIFINLDNESHQCGSLIGSVYFGAFIEMMCAKKEEINYIKVDVIYEAEIALCNINKQPLQLKVNKAI